MDIRFWFNFGLFLALFSFSFQANIASADQCINITDQVNFSDDISILTDGDINTSLLTTSTLGYEFSFPSPYFVCSVSWSTSDINSGLSARWDWGNGGYDHFSDSSIVANLRYSFDVSSAVDVVAFNPNIPVIIISEVVFYGYKSGPVGSVGIYNLLPDNVHYYVAPTLIAIILSLWGAFSGRNQAGHMSSVIILLIGFSFKYADIQVQSQFFYLFVISFLLMSGIWISGILKIFK